MIRIHLKIILLVIVALHCLEYSSYAQDDHRKVLVLDFIGFNDKGAEHGRTFKETVLPDADHFSIGIHGIIPDKWRKKAAYDRIIRASSKNHYQNSVSEVSGLIREDVTIISTDFNETWLLPNQLRKGLFNKIRHPSMVMARVAEKWLRANPDGKLILRGHSDGTYAEMYIFDYLKERDLQPAFVILESPRQNYKMWAGRAIETPETIFLSITSTMDLSRENMLDTGYGKIPSKDGVHVDNWRNYHVQGFRNPLSAHGVVTDYHKKLNVKKGSIKMKNVSLGSLVRNEIFRNNDQNIGSYFKKNPEQLHRYNFPVNTSRFSYNNDKSNRPRVVGRCGSNNSGCGYPDNKYSFFFGGPPPPPPPGGGSHNNIGLRNTNPVRSIPEFRKPDNNLRARPAGILLAPELEIVIDKSGFTDALASQALEAVKDDKSGGEFKYDGNTYIAVKSPGVTSNYHNKIGKYVISQNDLTLETNSEKTIALIRYYDSYDKSMSEIGAGWSFAPYTLDIGKRTTVINGHNVAIAPTLIDRSTGHEMTYRLDPSREVSTKEGRVSPYGKLTSPLQPDLINISNGDYMLLYDDGFKAVFNSKGIMKWTGNSEEDCMRFSYERDKLSSISDGTSKISFTYSEQTQTVLAAASNEQQVQYKLDESGHLKTVIDSGKNKMTFSYSPAGLLNEITGGNNNFPLLENSYDKGGRIIAHKSPKGNWKFKYNDHVGQFLITDLDTNEETRYYYNHAQQLIAYGVDNDDMTLLNYDLEGLISQVALGRITNNPSDKEKPKIIVKSVYSKDTENKIE